MDFLSKTSLSLLLVECLTHSFIVEKLGLDEQLLDASFEYRLGDEIVDAYHFCNITNTTRVIWSEHAYVRLHNGRSTFLFICLVYEGSYGFAWFKTIENWHVQIHNYELVSGARVLQTSFYDFKSLLSVIGHITLDLILFEDARDSVRAEQVILDDKNLRGIRLYTKFHYLVWLFQYLRKSVLFTVTSFLSLLSLLLSNSNLVVIVAIVI